MPPDLRVILPLRSSSDVLASERRMMGWLPFPVMVTGSVLASSSDASSSSSGTVSPRFSSSSHSSEVLRTHFPSALKERNCSWVSKGTGLVRRVSAREPEEFFVDEDLSLSVKASVKAHPVAADSSRIITAVDSVRAYLENIFFTVPGINYSTSTVILEMRIWASVVARTTLDALPAHFIVVLPTV